MPGGARRCPGLCGLFVAGTEVFTLRCSLCVGSCSCSVRPFSVVRWLMLHISHWIKSSRSKTHGLVTITCAGDPIPPVGAGIIVQEQLLKVGCTMTPIHTQVKDQKTSLRDCMCLLEQLLLLGSIYDSRYLLTCMFRIGVQVFSMSLNVPQS